MHSVTCGNHVDKPLLVKLLVTPPPSLTCAWTVLETSSLRFLCNYLSIMATPLEPYPQSGSVDSAFSLSARPPYSLRNYVREETHLSSLSSMVPYLFCPSWPLVCSGIFLPSPLLITLCLVQAHLTLCAPPSSAALPQVVFRNQGPKLCCRCDVSWASQEAGWEILCNHRGHWHLALPL